MQLFLDFNQNKLCLHDDDKLVVIWLTLFDFELFLPVFLCHSRCCGFCLSFLTVSRQSPSLCFFLCFSLCFSLCFPSLFLSLFSLFVPLFVFSLFYFALLFCSSLYLSLFNLFFILRLFSQTLSLSLSLSIFFDQFCLSVFFFAEFFVVVSLFLFDFLLLSISYEDWVDTQDIRFIKANILDRVTTNLTKVKHSFNYCDFLK